MIERPDCEGAAPIIMTTSRRLLLERRVVAKIKQRMAPSVFLFSSHLAPEDGSGAWCSFLFLLPRLDLRG